MLFTGAEIGGLIGQYLWPFVRVTAFVAAFPIFSSAFIPIQVRVVLALALTIAIVPSVPAVPQIDPVSAEGFMLVIQQVMIGVSMGFIFHMVFGAFVIGGQIIAMQMGLGFSTMIDPVNGSQAPVLSMMFLIMVTLFFLAMDGHLAVIRMLADSFQTLPIGLEGVDKSAFKMIVDWGSKMFEGALMLSLPAVTALLLVNIALGVMGRAAPQLNIFAVGFAITIAGGFYIILLSLPMMLESFKHLSLDGMEVIKTIGHVR
ncbi:MAG: flagellar biosynthetic protein FliR [Gammaproteobacteria bacterium]|nr:flagellar biosynthetic protein FliR [Gammaproteobacteria bacterium]